jgi:hypothetical protein
MSTISPTIKLSDLLEQLIPAESFVLAIKIHRLYLYELSELDTSDLKYLRQLDDLASCGIGTYGSASAAGKEAIELLNLIKWVRENK